MNNLEQKEESFNKKNTQNHTLISVFVLIVIILVGVVGYYFWQGNQSMIVGYEQRISELQLDSAQKKKELIS
jgi:flagellar basal body-associated protein FliL